MSTDNLAKETAEVRRSIFLKLQNLGSSSQFTLGVFVILFATAGTSLILLTRAAPEQISPSPAPLQSYSAEDVNHDSQVNFLDVQAIASDYKESSENDISDINGDGQVNLVDFSLLNSKLSN